MRALIGALLLLSGAVLAQDGTVRGISGVDLMAVCTAPDESSGSFCNGYITGLIDEERLHPAPAPMCLPRGADVVTVRLWFVHWAKRRPVEQLRRAASSLVREAVAERWPCVETPA